MNFLHFSRFFVTLEEISNHLCLSEVLEITQFSRLRFGNLLISVFCRDMRIVRALDSEPPSLFPLELRSLATKGTQVIALALRLSKNGSLSGARVHK